MSLALLSLPTFFRQFLPSDAAAMFIDLTATLFPCQNSTDDLTLSCLLFACRQENFELPYFLKHPQLQTGIYPSFVLLPKADVTIVLYFISLEPITLTYYVVRKFVLNYLVCVDCWKKKLPAMIHQLVQWVNLDILIVIISLL